MSNYLDQIIDAPELFAAYPEAKNIIVRTTDELPKNVGGRYLPTQKTILIKDSLTELQLDQIRRQNKKIQKAENWTESDIKTAQMLGLETDPAKVKEGAQKILDLITNAQLYEYRLTLIHEIQHFIQDQEVFARGGSTADLSFKDYRNLAGEVEARNATERSKMSMDERRNSLLTDTEDVAEESKIYLFDGDETSEFAVDKDGNQLFNVRDYGQKTISDIINDKSIPEDTEILTDSGNNIWGKITEAMAKAGKEFNLEALPIKLFKGNHGFGIVHIYKHLSDFPNQDLSRLMELVFGDINKIYARKDAGKIKLEIFPPKARYYGILELRKQDGFYSVVSFFTRKKQHENAKGKLIWVRSSQSATSQATSNQPKNEISGKMLQENQAELTAQTTDNINPFQEEVKPIAENNAQKMNYSDVRHSLREFDGKLLTPNPDHVKMMRTIVTGKSLDPRGEAAGDLGEFYAGKIREKYGVELSPLEAYIAASAAADANRSDSNKRAWNMAMEFYRGNNPLFDFFMEFSDSRILNPGTFGDGNEISGTFISEAYRKYGYKRPQGKKESDGSYKKYLAKREKALANADGTPIDEYLRLIHAVCGGTLSASQHRKNGRHGLHRHLLSTI